MLTSLLPAPPVGCVLGIWACPVCVPIPKDSDRPAWQRTGSVRVCCVRLAGDWARIDRSDHDNRQFIMVYRWGTNGLAAMFPPLKRYGACAPGSRSRASAAPFQGKSLIIHKPADQTMTSVNIGGAIVGGRRLSSRVLRRSTPKHAHFLEVGILAHDHEPVALGIVPNRGIASLHHSFQRNLACSRKINLQERHNSPRQIFVEQQFHGLAGLSPLIVAAMRSRSAA